MVAPIMSGGLEKYRERILRLRGSLSSDPAAVESAPAHETSGDIVSILPKRPLGGMPFAEIAGGLRTEAGIAKLSLHFRAIEKARDDLSNVVRMITRLANSKSPMDVCEAAEFAKKLGYHDQGMQKKSDRYFLKALRMTEKRPDEYADLRRRLARHLGMEQEREPSISEADAAAFVEAGELEKAARAYCRLGNFQRASAVASMALTAQRSSAHSWRAVRLFDVVTAIAASGIESGALRDYEQLCREVLLSKDGKVRNDVKPEAAAFEAFARQIEGGNEPVARPATTKADFGILGALGAPPPEALAGLELQPTFSLEQFHDAAASRPLGEIRALAAKFLLTREFREDIYAALQEDHEFTGDFDAAAETAGAYWIPADVSTYRAAARARFAATPA